ncbi:NAD(P)-dependent oxidoreductase [Psychrobacillus sp. BL-248-WT-3]|uniref:NAD(P)-dependent oxidoreductase n=1 Tax=Psychrobacillus sp. BL-248-WT-3 TaxID=2725306 RepID=UPI00146C1D0B|nr:NAD(P)-dependent oxidoreductase [Psychrobacillus sp. BL-248-WT-3]NME05144.1 NAD(P)-dependent oxidoreductase [Psychrobacillus sp. BL-248-WT-3]
MTEQLKIGFIGTGVMGKSIVKHLLKAGHEVSVYTRTKEKAEELLTLGARWVSKPSEAASSVQYLFTMVGYPHDVEEVYFGEEGIFSIENKGLTVIDLTTSTPTLAKKIDNRAKELDMQSLDAPVSGGDIGAQLGKLSIMCGGERETFDRSLSVLKLFGETILHEGTAGAGQHTKMCNQITIASNMIGVCEALTYGKKAGLELEQVLRAISTGAAGSWSLSNLAPRMIKGDLEPGFFIKHFVKDMKIALEESERMNLTLPGLELAKSLYDQLISDGYEDKGTQALIKLYE